MNNMGREIMAALKRFQVGSDGDGVTVGGALVVSGATTIANTATLGNVDINGGTIDGTTIGGASAAAGTFTTLSSTGNTTLGDASGDSVTINASTVSTPNGLNFDSNTLVIDATNDSVGIGTSSITANRKLHVYGSAQKNAKFEATTTTSQIEFQDSGTANQPSLGSAGNSLVFQTEFTERMRIDSSGNLLVNKTASNTSTVGFQFIVGDNKLAVGASDGASAFFNRNTNDGQIVQLAQDGTVEGTISVSGTTVSYNGGHLSRWAQLTTPKDDTPLFKGTVMSNLNEMNVYVDADGNTVDNEQLNKVKVSDVEGDANVAGVFVNWEYDEAHQVDEINMAMTGDMIIRIAQGTTVARGDLLMSAGDGTAKPQGDDIVRSKTIAKVTSTHVTCTYDDGSYCVPCVLMAC
jgi:hypothetical protein